MDYHTCVGRTLSLSHQIKVRKRKWNANIYNEVDIHKITTLESVLCSSLSPLFICTRGLKKKSPSFDSTDKDDPSHSQLFVPVQYKASEFEEMVGEEMVGPLKKEEVLSVMTRFYTDEDVKELAREQGLDQYLFQQTTISFRKFCLDSDSLPTDLHIVISDIFKAGCHLHDLYPFFFAHAKNIFPHLNCMDDLYKVSDLTQPPNWYPEARRLHRKIIFHAGPTNSGKTYHAMEQYLAVKSGVYCGPLKLLAVEVYEKSNNKGTPCDLVTGEERKYSVSEEFPSNHVSCTVEMTSLNTKYEVAIIDEIQMIRDPLRGWAWTRALLGLCADEVHVCGEVSALELVKELALSVGEDVEVRRYKRLTTLDVEETALLSLDMVRPGDCIVCFGRQQIHKVSQSIERLGHEVAVIYGGLPPGAKLAQAKKFNDPDHPCKIMVATDAIGMGLNLSIGRIIFNSLMKPKMNEKGEKEMDTLSVSSALQIAGRAGRYGTSFEQGLVTTFKSQDLPVLRRLLSSSPPDIEHAGLHPTAEQIELFAFHLPSYTLSNLIDIFVKLCTVDSSLYFMCVMDDFKFLADLIQHIPLPLRVRYIFCCAPINKKMPFVCALFLKFSRQYSENAPATLDWLCRNVKWPFTTPKTIHELVHLEEVFDVFDLYLWLSYRFPDMFPDTEMVRCLQMELDNVIQCGVSHITQLLRNEDLVVNGRIDADMETSHKQRIDIGSLRPSDSPANRRDPTNPFSRPKRDRKRQKEQSLTDRLLRQGILSKKMLQELKSEWKESEAKNDDDGFPSSKSKKRR